MVSECGKYLELHVLIIDLSWLKAIHNFFSKLNHFRSHLSSLFCQVISLLIQVCCLLLKRTFYHIHDVSLNPNPLVLMELLESEYFQLDIRFTLRHSCFSDGNRAYCQRHSLKYNFRYTNKVWAFLTICHLGMISIPVFLLVRSV